MHPPAQLDTNPTTKRAASPLARLFAWIRNLFRGRNRDGSGTPPNIYPLY